MASSSFLRLRHPLRLLAVSVAVFLALDNGIFRSGFYAQFADIAAQPVQVYNEVHFEYLRPPTGKREIMLVGSSTMHWGFWCKQYNEAHENSGYAFIQGAVAGTDEEEWYYILRAEDPNRNRYAAIVIPTNGYVVNAFPQDMAEDFNNATMVAPIISIADWPDVISHFKSPDLRWKAALLAAFPSHGYAADLQDLILHPAYRAKWLRLRWAQGAYWLYDWPGAPGTMEDFRLGSGSQPTVFPADLNSFERRDTLNQFVAPPSLQEAASNTARNAQFKSYWLNKIIARYAGTGTVLIFLQLPRHPMPLPAEETIPGAPDLRQLLAHNDNTVFLPEDAFLSLEHPKYFHDAIHMNYIARPIFTNLLGDDVMRVMEAQGAEAQRSPPPHNPT